MDIRRGLKVIFSFQFLLQMPSNDVKQSYLEKKELARKDRKVWDGLCAFPCIINIFCFYIYANISLFAYLFPYSALWLVFDSLDPRPGSFPLPFIICQRPNLRYFNIQRKHCFLIKWRFPRIQRGYHNFAYNPKKLFWSVALLGSSNREGCPIAEQDRYFVKYVSYIPTSNLLKGT